MAHYHYGTEVRVKGGMPVLVYGGVDSYGETELDSIRWASTDKPVTKAFRDSLSAADESAIYEALAQSPDW